MNSTLIKKYILTTATNKLLLVITFLGLSSGYAADSTFYGLVAPTTNAHYTFFNLASNDTVSLSDSATTNWDIAFKGTTILVNGGTSGSGSAMGQVVETAYTDLDFAPGDGFGSDGSTKAIPTGSGNGWYTYAGHPTHKIEPISGRTIVVKTSSGDYYKIEVISYYQGNPDLSTYTMFPPAEASGHYTFKFDKLIGTTLPSDEVFSDLVAPTTNAHYAFFNLASNDTVSLSDSATTNWDIAFKGTTILVNGGTSGPGAGMAQVVETIYDALDFAPSSGYSADGTTKAIPTGSGNGWYSYAGHPTHKIEPISGRTIVVRATSGKYYKVEVINYYEGNPDLSAYTAFPPSESSGHYTFKFAEISVTTSTSKDVTILPLQVYPNPIKASGIMNVSFDTQIGDHAQLVVYDLNGRVVIDREITTSFGINEYELGTHQLTSGIYQLALYSSGQLFQQKLVVR